MAPISDVNDPAISVTIEDKRRYQCITIRLLVDRDTFIFAQKLSGLVDLPSAENIFANAALSGYTQFQQALNAAVSNAFTTTSSCVDESKSGPR